MQINSVNQLMSYPKSSQNQNVKNLGRNNQPSFGKLLKLEEDNLQFIREEGQLVVARIIQALMESKELKKLFKAFDGNIKFELRRTSADHPFECSITDLKNVLEQNIKKHLLEKYKVAKVEPDEFLLKDIRFPAQHTLMRIEEKELVKMFEDTKMLYEFLDSIPQALKNMKKSITSNYNKEIKARFVEIDKDIKKKLTTRELIERLPIKGEPKTALSDLIEHYKTKVNSSEY